MPKGKPNKRYTPEFKINVSSTEKNQSSRHRKPTRISEVEQTEGFLSRKE